MDQDLMDSWLNCAYGVDCDTHRQALSEIQRLRDDLAHMDDIEALKGDLDDITADRDDLQRLLEAERKRSADLARRLDVIQDVILEKAA